jgi:hypothetical protein
MKDAIESKRPLKHTRKKRRVSKLVPTTSMAINFNNGENIWKQ